MFCPKCGSKNADTSKFCGNCGFSLAEKINHSSGRKQIFQKPNNFNSNNSPNIANKNQNFINTQKPIQAKKSSGFSSFGKVFVVLAIVIVLGVGGFTVYNFIGGNNVFIPKPEDTVKKFFDNTKNGNIDAAIECLSPDIQNEWKLGMGMAENVGSFFGISSSSALLNSIIGLSDAYSYKNYDFNMKDTTYQGNDKAKVNVEVCVNGSKKQTTTMELKKIDNKWYISK